MEPQAKVSVHGSGQPGVEADFTNGPITRSLGTSDGHNQLGLLGTAPVFASLFCGRHQDDSNTDRKLGKVFSRFR